MPAELCLTGQDATNPKIIYGLSNKRMTSQPQQSVGIIGAGIVGVQLARALQRDGYQVTLIDDHPPGHGTSWGNAGFIATDEIFPLARGRVLRSLPRMLCDPLSPLSMRWQEFPRLFPWFLHYARSCSTSRVTTSIEALASLQNHAATSWKTVVKNEGLSELVRETGAWKLFETDQAFHDTAKEREEQREFGVEIGRASCRERV